jgi:hypothetical protein
VDDFLEYVGLLVVPHRSPPLWAISQSGPPEPARDGQGYARNAGLPEASRPASLSTNPRLRLANALGSRGASPADHWWDAA